MARFTPADREQKKNTKKQSGKEHALPKTSPNGGLSGKEKDRLSKLPAVIERLEAEIAKLTEFLSDPKLYETAPEKFAKASEGLTERQEMLEKAEEEWLMLEEKAAE